MSERQDDRAERGACVHERMRADDVRLPDGRGDGGPEFSFCEHGEHLAAQRGQLVRMAVVLVEREGPHGPAPGEVVREKLRDILLREAAEREVSAEELLTEIIKKYIERNERNGG